MSRSGRFAHLLTPGRIGSLTIRNRILMAPMGDCLPNEDGTVWVVFNGEIYNFKELRRDLEKRGHGLRTTGDTETIVHLYEEYGPDLVDRLRGMFAFALWDTRERQLLLARDRVGIKPLFYARLHGALAFGSELKCLLQLPDVSRRLSWPAVGHLFAFLSTPANQSIVDGVQKLEPGHRAILRRDGRLRQGMRTMLVGFGVGLSWAGCLWTDTWQR